MGNDEARFKLINFGSKVLVHQRYLPQLEPAIADPKFNYWQVDRSGDNKLVPKNGVVIKFSDDNRKTGKDKNRDLASLEPFIVGRIPFAIVPSSERSFNGATGTETSDIRILVGKVSDLTPAKWVPLAEEQPHEGHHEVGTQVNTFA